MSRQGFLFILFPMLLLSGPLGATELISNGNFATGDLTDWSATNLTNGARSCQTDWNVGSSGSATGCNSASPPETAGFAAYNSFDGAGPLEYRLTQQVAVPSGLISAQLSWSQSYNLSHLGQARTFEVLVTDQADSTVLTTVFSRDFATNANNTPDWEQLSEDVLATLSNHENETVTVVFRNIVPESFTGPGGFGLDSVSLQVTNRELSISPAVVDFGDQVVGTTSAAASVTLSNTGDADLDVTGISAANAPFAAAGGTCGAVPFTLAPASSCTLDYTFSPTATGTATDTITVNHNAPSSPDSFGLEGNGIQAALSMSPAVVDFGDQVVGTTSAAASVTLSNTGDADLDVTGISTANAPFAAAGGTCGTVPFTLAPASSCTLDYTFSPTATSTATDTITVDHNAPSSPDSFGLEGNGIQADLLLDTTSVVFEVPFGDSASESITITNTGDADLSIEQIDGLDSPFGLTGGSCFPLPSTLTPGASCTIEVTFDSGSVSGTFDDSLEITSNSDSSPDSVTVRGTMMPVRPIPALNPAGLLLLILALVLIANRSIVRP